MPLLYLAILPMTSFITCITTCNIQNSRCYILRTATESDHYSNAFKVSSFVRLSYFLLQTLIMIFKCTCMSCNKSCNKLQKCIQCTVCNQWRTQKFSEGGREAVCPQDLAKGEVQPGVGIEASSRRRLRGSRGYAPSRLQVFAVFT